MPSKTNLGVAIDGNGVLIPIADAVPLLGASVKGSLEALQKILQYNEQVKNNKEESLALAKHARNLTSTLFASLQSLEDLDPLKSNIKDFVRLLNNIAAFCKERAGRSMFDRLLKKQSDADKLKRWRQELTNAFERVNISALLDIKMRASKAH